ncbi:Coiled-coil domain-containing protein 12 [Fasciola gigantica]|uniref:Coiled-coil domain-containing protein 12 n=1 Tax=Fasciola gigantica TaxID=46835 RepID=A0A504YG73_FASGI|nr:Coiled-coil domain-containing protein 12 [Fasciola gigantica]
MTTMNLESDDVEDDVLPMETEVKTGEENRTVGHLRDEALRRKRRLAQLKQQNSQRTNGVQDDEDVGEDAPLPKPIFRNYKPQSEDLKEGELPSAPMVDLTSLVNDQLEAAAAPVVVEEVNLMNLAPRKPDWDLKRGVEKKLQKLERRTQRAIAELIRERLRETQPDLATAVSQQPAPFT